MTTTLEVDYRMSSAAHADAHVSTVPAAVSPAYTEHRPLGLPFAVPRSQLYYWTHLWREGVARSRDALHRGDYVDFTSDDPYDVIRWLFDAEDD